MPVIDTANQVMIDPTRNTLVTTDAIPGASVQVDAGNLHDRQGQMFDDAIGSFGFSYADLEAPFAR